MGYRQLDHTADLAIEITAPRRDDLFAEALLAFTDCVTDRRLVEPRVERRLTAAAEALDELMLEWLSAALVRFELEGLLFSAARVAVRESAAGLSVAGDCAGEPWSEERHPLKILIKGVTYHALEVGTAGDLWRARVVFDI